MGTHPYKIINSKFMANPQNKIYILNCNIVFKSNRKTKVMMNFNSQRHNMKGSRNKHEVKLGFVWY